MNRLIGRYGRFFPEVNIQDYQIRPEKFASSRLEKFPIQGPFTSVRACDGRVSLYSSASSTVPLYYSISRNILYWHEQKLALPGSPKRVKKGEVVRWTAGEKEVSSQIIDTLPCPPINYHITEQEAIAAYKSALLLAVRRRLETLPPNAKVAVAQSARLDSFLIIWALLQMGANIVPITVGLTADCWDIKYTASALKTLDIEHYPVILDGLELGQKFRESALCFEKYQTDELVMGACCLAIALKARELGVSAIFTGHAHDDLHGASDLAQERFNSIEQGTPDWRWAEARRKSFEGMELDKIFSATFRRYGIDVHSPFSDPGILHWAFSLPASILPVDSKKPLAWATAQSLIPEVELWNAEKYIRKGYTKGTGFSDTRNSALLKSSLEESKNTIGFLKATGWKQRASFHQGLQG